jgi:hypothetical protein
MRKAMRRRSPSTTGRHFADMCELLRRTPPDHPLRVYRARGPKGLVTALARSLNWEMLGYVGAVNVAADPNRNGLATVLAEQIVARGDHVRTIIVDCYGKFYHIDVTERQFDRLLPPARWRAGRPTRDG